VRRDDDLSPFVGDGAQEVDDLAEAPRVDTRLRLFDEEDLPRVRGDHVDGQPQHVHHAVGELRGLEELAVFLL